MKNKLLKILLITVFFSAFNTTAVQCNEGNIFSKSLKYLMLVYASIASSTLTHEFGHALSAKVLDGDPINVHFGTLNAYDKVLFKVKGLTAHSVNPFLGFAQFTTPDNLDSKKDKFKSIIKCINGPLFGILATVLQASLLGAYVNKFPNAENREIINKLNEYKYFETYIAGQALYGFTPFVFSFGDGKALYNYLGFNPEKLDKLCLLDGIQHKYGIMPSLLALALASKLIVDSAYNFKNIVN